ncbi:hypothetical protein B7494_g7503 [Chlorociboria aeruginascens]|nr:hypothetical protein B7494_g7503 [Chlorociboria aeruginascens]
MSPPRLPTDAIDCADELLEKQVSGVTSKIESDGQRVTLDSGDLMGSDVAPENALPLISSQDEKGLPITATSNTDGSNGGPESNVMGNKQGTTMADDKRLPVGEISFDHEAMESSTVTLKPDSSSYFKMSSDQQLYLEVPAYLDPTPNTPASSQPPSRSASSAESIPHFTRSADRSPTRSDGGFDERRSFSEDEREVSSKSEIQSIMDQFSQEGRGPGHEEVMSPRLEFAGPLLGSPVVQHPPRKSSLEPLNPNAATQSLKDLRISTSSFNQQLIDDSDVGPMVPPKPGSIHSFSQSRIPDDRGSEGPISPSGPSLHRPPPPEPEPESDLPFDFHRFLEQLRHRTADPVKIIGDFLAFITNKMAQCEVWREVSDAEFDNAREGMEKLVMNRLYTQTFSPAIPPPQPVPGPRPKRKGTERPMGPGRRGQHQEDVERDDILAQKISIYGWVKEEHLDIPPVGDSGRRFLILAQQGLLKHSKADSSADSFMPLLIYVVLQGNPEHLVSNVQYILRFRNQDKLGGEAGYYLSSLMGAVQFIENLDRTTLTITDEDFEKYVEAAVLTIAEKHSVEEVKVTAPKLLLEKSTLSHPEVTPRHSSEGEPSTPRKSTSSNEDAVDEKAAISGILRTIQRPLSSIGRIFSEDASTSPSVRTPLANTPRPTPSPRVSTDQPHNLQLPTNARDPITRKSNSRDRMTAEDAAARQASAEVAEAHRIQRAEHINIVETLAGMFPDLDRDIISDVVAQKDGRVGLAVDACLALSS